jgi:hypothetical protein
MWCTGGFTNWRAAEHKEHKERVTWIDYKWIDDNSIDNNINEYQEQEHNSTDQNKILWQHGEGQSPIRYKGRDTVQKITLQNFSNIFPDGNDPSNQGLDHAGQRGQQHKWISRTGTQFNWSKQYSVAAWWGTITNQIQRQGHCSENQFAKLPKYLPDGNNQGLDHDQGLDTQAKQAESPDYLPDGNDQSLDHAGDASGIEEGEADR